MLRSFFAVGFVFTESRDTIDVKVDIDVGAHPEVFEHYWKRSFGSGHAKLTLRKDWQAHLARAVEDLGLQGVRYHGIFDDDMSVVTAPGVYNFTLIDQSWDYQLSLGLTPIVELSFMPCVLAGCSWHGLNPGQPACKSLSMDYEAVTQTPNDYEDWYDLVRSLVTHAVDRYGLQVVRNWSFEVWNEMWGMPFPSEYMKLYNASALAVKSVDSKIKVGGPATARLADISEFVDECTKRGLPFDFVSTHMYPTDPQCGGHKPGLNWKPDCFTDGVKEGRASIPSDVPFYMTEYNVGCCLEYAQHDDSGAAAFAFKSIGELAGVPDVLSWWTFSDIFEEGGLTDKEFNTIYGAMTFSGVPKPAWRAFELLHKHAGSLSVPVNVSSSALSPLLMPSQTTPLGACSEETQTNMVGFDILPETQHLMLPDKESCCEACQNRSADGCVFWSYGLSGDMIGRCFLKNSDAGRKTDVSMVSGSAAPPAPPPPAADLVRAFATIPEAGGLPTVFLSFWENGGPDDNRLTRRVSVEVQDSKNRAALRATQYRIDDANANPLAAWKGMGSPGKPTPEQLQQLMAASEVKPHAVEVTDGVAVVAMPPNSAVLIAFERADEYV